MITTASPYARNRYNERNRRMFLSYFVSIRYLLRAWSTLLTPEICGTAYIPLPWKGKINQALSTAGRQHMFHF